MGHPRQEISNQDLTWGQIWQKTGQQVVPFSVLGAGYLGLKGLDSR